MANVGISGAAGFIGSWIAKELVKQGHYVVGIDDLSGGSIQNIDSIIHSHNFRFVKGSCSDPYVTDIFFRDGKFDAYYHLAANAREGASFFQPVSVVRRNTMAYTTMLMNAIKYGVRRIILFSSIAAYGEGEDGPPFTEEMKLRPVDIYGLQKANMEQMTDMMSICHGFEYVIFRPFNVYGPFQALNDPYRNLFGIILNKIMRREPLQIYGDGSQMRAFSYIEDSLPCYIKAMTVDIDRWAICNIGATKPYTVKDAILTTLRVMEEDPDIYPIEYLPDRHGEVHEAWCANLKAKKFLGFVENHDLTQGLRKMAKWAKEQGPQKWQTGDPIELTESKLLPRNWREK